MKILDKYNQFAGRHYETGSIKNVLDYQGVNAPHTDEPFSEALLLGVSGGVVMGYYTFAYKGYDPHVALLTRNTFYPWDTLLGRMGIVQDVYQTTNPVKAHSKLIDALENGTPAIVWVDQYLLPYNGLSIDSGMWDMQPVVVYEIDGEIVKIADRAEVALKVGVDELKTARSRVKKEKHKFVTLSHPDPAKLAFAVSQGIHETIRFYTEGPPRGSKKNFGFEGFKTLMDVLVKPNHRMSWEKEFPIGRKMFAGMTSTYHWIALYAKDGLARDAERGMYADFLDEASLILERPGLRDAADNFRSSAKLWQELSEALLPKDVPLFKKTKELMVTRHRVFLEKGATSLEERRAIDKQLDEIKFEMETNFPWNEKQSITYKETIRELVAKVFDSEKQAIDILKDTI